jgi:endogenous inhibitor of DNA gyrase (YacG/DUF329 family)
MKAYRYSLECPECKKTYESEREVILAESADLVPSRARQNHQACPLCGHPFPPDLAIKISVRP